jgi:hypothetical protein
MCQAQLIFEFKVGYFYFGAVNDRLSGTSFNLLFLLANKYVNSTSYHINKYIFYFTLRFCVGSPMMIVIDRNVWLCFGKGYK